jgi:hypothetical protein
VTTRILPRVIPDNVRQQLLWAYDSHGSVNVDNFLAILEAEGYGDMPPGEMVALVLETSSKVNWTIHGHHFTRGGHAI